MTDRTARRLMDTLRGQGWTQPALAKALGTKQGVVQRWFTGGGLPSATWLAPLCRALRVNIHWLLTGDGPMEPPAASPGTVREFDLGYQAGWQAAKDKLEEGATAPAAPDVSSAMNALEAVRKATRATGGGGRAARDTGRRKAEG